MLSDKHKSACLQRLISSSDWQILVDHIKECARNHDLASSKFAKMNDVESAKRQAWIAEGLIEAIEEPERFIGWADMAKNKVKDFCKQCGQKLYETFFHLTDIVTQLPPIFEAFYQNPERSTCRKCGTRAEKN